MKVTRIVVSDRTVTLVISQNGWMGKPRTLGNTPEGYSTLIQVLRKARVSRVCFKSTGLYYLDPALILNDAGLEVMVTDSKATKRFAEDMRIRTKTDAVDAAILAVRACARHINAMSEARTQTQNELHAARQTAVTPDFLLAESQQTIALFDAQIRNLRQQILDLIAADQNLQQTFELLVSVTGIAATSAIQLLGELLVLPQDMSAKQWVAMAGLDPRAHSSGSGVNKKPRLSKAGNRHLRIALYMLALNATRQDPQVRAYYHHLIETRGPKEIQAVCTVMRKLLHAIHGMLKTRTPFDSSRFYTPTETGAD